jgi:hypothetical protein
MTDPKVPAPEPAYWQKLVTGQLRPLFAADQMETYAAAREAAARMEERERCARALEKLAHGLGLDGHSQSNAANSILTTAAHMLRALRAG